ncbi:MAG: ABC transporter permease [Phycisphaerales bacterium]
MRIITLIAHRELASYFRAPIGWVVVAAFLFVAGLTVAFTTLRPNEPATMRDFFALSHWLLLMVAPAVSMRLFSEEFRSGTIEPLMTAPVSDWQTALGKYLGGLLFLLLMLAPTLAHVALLEWVADPDYGPILAGYTGLILVGMLYLAVGLLMSSLTANQMAAYLGTLFFFLVVFFATSQGARLVGAPWDSYLMAAAPGARLEDFARGIIDTRHVIFFASISAFFIVLAVVSLESRRWR